MADQQKKTKELQEILTTLIKDLNLEKNELDWNDDVNEVKLNIKDLLEEGINKVDKIKI
jgi:hypothetical protein